VPAGRESGQKRLAKLFRAKHTAASLRCDMILGLDTATEWVYLALADQGDSWTKRVLTGPSNSASSVLLPSVDELLHDAGASRKEIKGVAACVGPGGFTSLRVGVATAEGFAINGLSVWGFSAFELRARALRLASQASASGQKKMCASYSTGSDERPFFRSGTL